MQNSSVFVSHRFHVKAQNFSRMSIPAVTSGAFNRSQVVGTTGADAHSSPETSALFPELLASDLLSAIVDHSQFLSGFVPNDLREHKRSL